MIQVCTLHNHTLAVIHFARVTVGRSRLKDGIVTLACIAH